MKDLSNFKSQLKKISLNRDNILKAPSEPGIYIFWREKSIPQYVGKSISLKNRLLSYISSPLGQKTKEMVKSSDSFSYVRVGSELESLLLEAKLIRNLQPKYNIELKDDKNPLYIKITKEEFPQVLTARSVEEDRLKNSSFYGPFPSSGIVKRFLKMIRRTIPFAQHKIEKKPCLYSQIGLCSPCPNAISIAVDKEQRAKLKKIYLKNIRLIKKILDGQISNVTYHLDIMMKNYSNKLDFENAALVKNQINNLEYITQSITRPNDFIKNPNLLSDIRNKERFELEHIISHFYKTKDIRRIECYDIAHLAGTNPTASMVTFIDGESEKSLYRRFKIDVKHGGDDFASLREVAKRRFKHLADPSSDEAGWGKPDLMIIDGGKGQVDAFLSIFEDTNIPIIGLAKRFETLIIPVRDNLGKNYKLIRLQVGPLLYLVQRIRNEAHRFARSYHHKLIQNSLLAG